MIDPVFALIALTILGPTAVFAYYLWKIAIVVEDLKEMREIEAAIQPHDSR